MSTADYIWTEDGRYVRPLVSGEGSQKPQKSKKKVKFSHKEKVILMVASWIVALFVTVLMGVPRLTYIVFGPGVYFLIFTKWEQYQAWQKSDREPKYVDPTIKVILFVHFVLLPFATVGGGYNLPDYGNFLVNNLAYLGADFIARLVWFFVFAIPYILIAIIVIHYFVYVPNLPWSGKILAYTIYAIILILCLLWIRSPFIS